MEKNTGWQPHHIKYSWTSFVIMVNGFWVIVDQCSCGSTHSYEILDREPSPELQRKSVSDLTDEIRKHLFLRVPMDKLIENYNR